MKPEEDTAAIRIAIVRMRLMGMPTNYIKAVCKNNNWHRHSIQYVARMCEDSPQHRQTVAEYEARNAFDGYADVELP